MKARHSVLGAVIVGLALSFAGPAGAASAASSSALLSQPFDRLERPAHGRDKDKSKDEPSSVPELDAGGAASAALLVLAGAAIVFARRRRSASV